MPLVFVIFIEMLANVCCHQITTYEYKALTRPQSLPLIMLYIVALLPSFWHFCVGGLALQGFNSVLILNLCVCDRGVGGRVFD